MSQSQLVPEELGNAIAATPGAQISDDPGSSYLVSVQVEPQFEDRLDPDRLHTLATGVLEAERASGPLEVGIVVTTDAEVRALNKQYLDHDYDTDVLSFSMSDEEGDFVTPAERPPYLGDVVISYERAAEQGPEYGHDAATEVATLLIHGLLHLLGYDDHEDADREKMHARQQHLLETIYGKS